MQVEPLQANDYDTVDLRFIDFNIEPGETCEFDSLEISAMGRAKKWELFFTASCF